MTYFYYMLVGFLAAASAWQYVSGHIARACFALIGLGIMLILNEVKRNAKVVNCYTECSFFTSPPDFAPQPGPDAPGTPERGADDGTER